MISACVLEPDTHVEDQDSPATSTVDRYASSPYGSPRHPSSIVIGALIDGAVEQLEWVMGQPQRARASPDPYLLLNGRSKATPSPPARRTTSTTTVIYLGRVSRRLRRAEDVVPREG